MNVGKTLFAQVMEFVPWKTFTRIIERHKGDAGVRTLSCADLFRVMAFAQLTWRESLRDIEACLAANQAKLFHMGLKAAPARSTLADALNLRDWRIYHALAQRLIARARALYAQEPSVLELDASVYALDSTTIDLCLSVFDWAPFRSTKAAIKLHTLLDLRGSIPAFIHISDGKLHDVNVLDILPVEAGAFYVMDRGYLDFERLYAMHQAGAFFVTRAKTGMDARRVSSAPTDRTSGVICDQRVMLKLARNMRLALPNAAFIGFTGTPLFKHDELTKRIFGDYVSRYDFKRSEEDGATVKLVYENRGEKLGLARLDLNEKIAAAVDAADLDPDQTALLEKLLGKDYEVITADERLAKIAADFVEHCSTRWEAGKAMLVCIDKITCARMLMLIEPAWKAKAVRVRADAEAKLGAIADAPDEDTRQQLHAQRDRLLAKAAWLEQTIVEIIISEAQNEVADFKKWGFDIIPHRARMKLGFETPDGKRVDVESAFKNPQHPFRVAIVCAMWLTGFDVECLSTLYIDKPMRAHTLMQAIARANRRYPGKDFGLIVDYNGMLKSLREALAQYALGDDAGGEEIVAPLEERVAALHDAIEVTEAHLQGLGFDPAALIGAKGFARIQGLADAVDAVYTNDEAKRRFEILARVAFSRFKALLVEPSALAYAERHDNIEAVYKKLTERRDTADVSALLKILHRIVNHAIATQGPGADQAEGLRIDLSQIDMDKLRDEFAKRVKRKATVIEDIRKIVEDKLAQMLARNPLRMNYEKEYQEIIAAYNQDKDRATVEDTFAKLIDLAHSLDAEQRRAVEEGLSEDQLALFDLLQRTDLAKPDRERVKQASRELLAGVLQVIAPLDRWTEKSQTQAEVETFILDRVFEVLPEPPYSPGDKQQLAALVYRHIWQQSVGNQ